MTEPKSLRVNLQVATDSPVDLPAAADFEHWVQVCLQKSVEELPPGACITLRLVGEQESAGLNARFRGKDRATNVLAFPAGMPVIPEAESDETELGDLIICMDVVGREAKQQGKTLADHLAHLTIHGTLHLVGYDHIEAADAAEMEALETRLLAELGIADPYQYRDAV